MGRRHALTAGVSAVLVAVCAFPAAAAEPPTTGPAGCDVPAGLGPAIDHEVPLLCGNWNLVVTVSSKLYRGDRSKEGTPSGPPVGSRATMAVRLQDICPGRSPSGEIAGTIENPCAAIILGFHGDPAVTLGPVENIVEGPLGFSGTPAGTSLKYDGAGEYRVSVLEPASQLTKLLTGAPGHYRCSPPDSQPLAFDLALRVEDWYEIQVKNPLVDKVLFGDYHGERKIAKELSGSENLPLDLVCSTAGKYEGEWTINYKIHGLLRNPPA